MTRRFFLILIGLALLVAVAVGLRGHFSTHTTLLPTPTPGTASSLTTYTNPTFGYSLSIPTTWTATPADLDNDISDSAINFASDSLLFTLQVANKTTYPNLDLKAFATESITPKDKVTISEVTNLKIGDRDGIREKVVTNDSTFSGLVYLTEDSKFFYTIFTYQTSEAAEITTPLSTFRTKSP